jgi:glycosyltransferase involved in cell wall biosynthesis
LTIKENLPTFFERDNIALSVTKWDMGRHPEVFLEIAKYIKKGKIILAGGWTDTNYKINFQKSVVRLGLNNKLEVTDSISEESLLKLYSKAKVALRFGYNEKGPGMGALESISFGLPLIINNGIGIKEVLTKGVDCVIVDEKSSVVIAEYLDLFFSNSTEWEKYSYSALKKAKELSWETHKESWRKILYG